MIQDEAHAELVEEGVFGFNILRFGPRWLALHQDEGVFDIARIRSGHCTRVLTGRSLGELKMRLLREHGSADRVALSPREAASLRAVRACIRPGSKVIAFFCPDQAFRKNFGALPKMLEERGYTVLYLYGLQAGDEFERHPTSFHVGGLTLEYLDCVDLWFTATTMDALPRHGKRVLLNHGAFAPFVPEARQASIGPAGPVSPAEGDLEQTFQRVARERTHNFSFFPLYDYYIASTVHHMDLLRGLAAGYGYATAGSTPLPADPVCALFDRRHRLQNKPLTDRVCVIPGGYPQIDATASHIARHAGRKDTITFAPTPLNGKPTWIPYSALHAAGPAIIRALIEAFPDYQIVFKPHVTDANEATLQAIRPFEGVTNFRVDLSGSDHKSLYARTAVLVSDFSSTAYTFALAALRPVVFFSPNEPTLPRHLREGAFCSERTHVGRVVSDTTAMVGAIRELLRNDSGVANQIERFRDSRLFQPGNSEAYLCDCVERMIAGAVGPDWTVFQRGGFPLPIARSA